MFTMGHLKHKLWPKERPKVKLTVWFPTIKSQEFPPISLCIGVMPHTIGKLSTRVTTLLQTSSQSEVCTQSYGPPKSWESQLWEFQDSQVGVLGQNDIWVLISWPNTKYTIKGEGGGLPQVRAVVSFVSLCLPMIRPSTKSAITTH
jgi:hypothetical protein